MPPDTVFTIVQAGRVLATVGLALVIFQRAQPANRWLRGLIAVVAGWLSAVAYTVYVYNPAGIEAERYFGTHFPENHFDNNTIAVALIGGWIAPTFAVAVFAAVLKFRDWLAARAVQRTPNNSLERTRER